MSLNGRLDKLEEQETTRRVREAARIIGQEVDCPSDELIRRAERIADLIEAHGRERAIEIIAERSGSTPECLETAAARLAALIA